MKIKKYILFIIFLILSSINIVSAKISTYLYCNYNNGMYINIKYKETFKIESNITDLDIGNNGYESLKENRFIDSYNNFSCPSYIEVVDNQIINFLEYEDKDNLISLNKEDSYCKGSCVYKEIEDEIDQSDNVNNTTKNMEVSKICKDPTILKAFRATGKILFITKIVIPIILMIMGVFDFTKAIISPKDGVIKASKTFFIRVTAGLLIFFLPTLVSFVLGLLPETEFDFRECNTCLKHPFECEIIKETN